jgi:hypothetical protein
MFYWNRVHWALKINLFPYFLKRIRLAVHEEYSNNRTNQTIYIVFQIMVQIYQALVVYCNTTQGIYIYKESKELRAL